MNAGDSITAVFRDTGVVVSAVRTVTRQKSDRAAKSRARHVTSGRDFSPDTGECGIYFRVTVDPADQFTSRIVTPIAARSLPPRQPLNGFNDASRVSVYSSGSRIADPTFHDAARRLMRCTQNSGPHRPFAEVRTLNKRV